MECRVQSVDGALGTSRRDQGVRVVKGALHNLRGRLKHDWNRSGAGLEPGNPSKDLSMELWGLEVWIRRVRRFWRWEPLEDLSQRGCLVQRAH